MEMYDLFYKWVPVYLRLPILFIWFLVILVANGVFAGTMTDTYSSLGVYAEPYTQAYNSMYIGMGLGLILHVRLKMRFSNKILLTGGFTAMLLMNIICATTSNPSLTIFACFIIGFTKISAYVEVYLIWIIIWSKKLDTRRVYPFVYFTALCGLHLITWLTTWLAYTYNWRYAYIVIVCMLLVCILLVLIFAENHPLKKKIPLYQADYPGLLLLASAMMLLNYVVVNGKVEDWLGSKKIIGALSISVITFLLFIIREFNVRHPIFDLQLFKRANFRLGLLYFFLLGIFIPGTFQSAFSGTILHYEMIRNMELNLFMIPGIMLGCVVSYVWYLEESDPNILIFTGFLSFVVYHVLMYNRFLTDFNIQGFWLPSLIKGFGTALVYIAVGLYLTKNLGLKTILSAAGAMILVRSFLGSAVCSSLYTYFLYAERIRRFNYLAGLTDANNSLVKEHGSVLDFYKNLQEQATLTASKELSGYIIIAGIILLSVLLIGYLYQKTTNKILNKKPLHKYTS
jgi:DHA2 family multidrug resistance protein